MKLFALCLLFVCAKSQNIILQNNPCGYGYPPVQLNPVGCLEQVLSPYGTITEVPVANLGPLGPLPIGLQAPIGLGNPCNPCGPITPCGPVPISPCAPLPVSPCGPLPNTPCGPIPQILGAPYLTQIGLANPCNIPVSLGNPCLPPVGLTSSCNCNPCGLINDLPLIGLPSPCNCGVVTEVPIAPISVNPCGLIPPTPCNPYGNYGSITDVPISLGNLFLPAASPVSGSINCLPAQGCNKCQFLKKIPIPPPFI